MGGPGAGEGPPSLREPSAERHPTGRRPHQSYPAGRGLLRDRRPGLVRDAAHAGPPRRPARQHLRGDAACGCPLPRVHRECRCTRVLARRRATGSPCAARRLGDAAGGDAELQRRVAPAAGLLHVGVTRHPSPAEQPAARAGPRRARKAALGPLGVQTTQRLCGSRHLVTPGREVCRWRPAQRSAAYEGVLLGPRGTWDQGLAPTTGGRTKVLRAKRQRGGRVAETLPRRGDVAQVGLLQRVWCLALGCARRMIDPSDPPRVDGTTQGMAPSGAPHGDDAIDGRSPRSCSRDVCWRGSPHRSLAEYVGVGGRRPRYVLIGTVVRMDLSAPPLG